MFTDDARKLEELCGPNDSIYAVVPSPQTAHVPAALAPLVPQSLSRPIHNHVENCKKVLARATVKQEEERQQVENLQAKWEEERRREKAEREAERKLDEARWEARWEAKRDEERKREAAAREEERKREAAVREEERKCEKSERCLEKVEADKKYEDLRRHLLEVEEMTMDTVGWIAHNVHPRCFKHSHETDYQKKKDTKMLDRIKLRHLLNKAQEMLALAAGLTQEPFGASLFWREALGTPDDTSARLTQARALLCAPGIQLDRSTERFVSSDDGMRLVVEANSPIRQRGDRVAHPVSVPRRHFDGPISRNSYSSETSGLQALADFVCSST